MIDKNKLRSEIPSVRKSTSGARTHCMYLWQLKDKSAISQNNPCPNNRQQNSILSDGFYRLRNRDFEWVMWTAVGGTRNKRYGI